ncbi:hypothetical protein [Parashewanella curva]|nr:hypothetical protein [Parashewanella curva]
MSGSPIGRTTAGIILQQKSGEDDLTKTVMARELNGYLMQGGVCAV